MKGDNNSFLCQLLSAISIYCQPCHSLLGAPALCHTDKNHNHEPFYTHTLQWQAPWYLAPSETLLACQWYLLNSGIQRDHLERRARMGHGRCILSNSSWCLDLKETRSQTHSDERTLSCTGTHPQTHAHTHTVWGIKENKKQTGFHNVQKKYNSIYMLMVGGNDPDSVLCVSSN